MSSSSQNSNNLSATGNMINVAQSQQHWNSAQFGAAAQSIEEVINSSSSRIPASAQMYQQNAYFNEGSPQNVAQRNSVVQSDFNN
jgi:hypothetical protein